MDNLAEEAKTEVIRLLRSGDRPGALAYLQSSLGVAPEDAERLVHFIEEKYPVTPPAVMQARGTITGCVVIALRAIAVFFLMFTLGFGISATGIYIMRAHQLSRSDLVSGFVVAFDTTDDGAAPIVHYEYNHVSYRTTGTVHATPPSFAMGEEVSLYVLRADPTTALIRSFDEQWLDIVTFGVVAGLFLLFALFLFFIARRIRRARL